MELSVQGGNHEVTGEPRWCETRELVLNGKQLEEEQRGIIARHHKQLAEDQAIMPGSPLSFNVEEVRCTLQDVF